MALQGQLYVAPSRSLQPRCDPDFRIHDDAAGERLHDILEECSTVKTPSFSRMIVDPSIGSLSEVMVVQI